MKRLFIFLLLAFTVSVNFVAAQTPLPPSTGGIASGQQQSSCPYIYISDGKTLQRINLSQYLQGFSNISSNDLNNPDSTNTYTYYYYDIKNGTKQTVTYTRKQQLDDFAKQYQNIACPPTIQDLQSLFLKLVVVLNTVVGLIIFFVIGKAGVMRMTSRGNPEVIKKSSAMISNAILGIIIVFVAYIILIFIGTQLLSSDTCYRFSFVDSGRILFFFDQSDIAPVLDQSNPNCSNPTV